MKKALYLFAVLLTSFIIMSCDNMSNNNNNNSNSNTIPANCTVLRVLDYAQQDDPMMDMWNKFQRENPDIYIIREVLFKDDFHKKTESYAASGQMPDVFYMWPAGRSSTIHDKKLAKDLMPFLKKDGLVEKYSAACLDPAQQKAGYVAEIPFGLTTTNCIFVNMKVLKEAGINAPAKTYEELKQQVKILKEKGKKGIIMANQDDWVMQSCLFSMICGRFGGANWAKDVFAGKTNLYNDGPFRKAVEFVKQMYDDGVLTQESLATPYSEVPGQFASEQGAYLIDGDWRAGAFLTDLSTGKALIPVEKQASDIELIQFPKIPGEVYALANSGALGVGYGMSSAIEAGSAKEEAAWRLIKWLSGKTVQQKRLDTGASFPSWTDGLDYSNLEPISAKRSKWYGTAATVTPVFDAVFPASVASVVNKKLQELGQGLKNVNDVCAAVQDALEKALPAVSFPERQTN